MIDTATKAIVMDTVEQAKDAVQEGVGQLADRLKDASPVTRRRRSRRRITTRALLLAVLAGGIAAAIVAWRRASTAREATSPSIDLDEKRTENASRRAPDSRVTDTDRVTR